MLNTPITQDLLYGAIEIEQTADGFLPHRLPAWARARADGQMAMAEAQPSGVRLVFSTEAQTIELVTLPTKRAYGNLPPRPDGVYDLLINGVLVQQATARGGKVLSIDIATGATSLAAGEPQTLRFEGLPAPSKTIEIWLPHDETTELVGLRTDAPVMPLPPMTSNGKRRWLHHGSSISQGSNGASPTSIWPAVAAARGGVALFNLGFSGNALLDPFVARTMRDLPADLLSLKLGINLVNTDLMRMRAFGPAVHGFLDTIRDGHPDTPLLVISPIYCPIHEDTPGPTQFVAAALREGQLLFRASGNAKEARQGKLTLSTIREQLRAIVQQRAEHDPHIHYLDGTELYGGSDNARLPLPDELHPDAATHQLMGARFADLAFSHGAFA